MYMLAIEQPQTSNVQRLIIQAIALSSRRIKVSLSVLDIGRSRSIQRLVVLFLCPSPLDNIRNVPHDRQQQTNSQYRNTNNKRSSISRFIILPEDLRSVNTGRIGTHNNHGHRQCPLFRVSRGQRHPSDIKRVRERSESLGPDDSKVSNAFTAHFGEYPIEDITQQVACETSNDGWSAEVEVVGYV